MSDPVSKSQNIVQSWNESLKDIASELVYSLEKPLVINRMILDNALSVVTVNESLFSSWAFTSI